MATDNTRDVPEHLVPAVLAVIEKANKRAARLGVAGFTVSQGQPVTRRHPVEEQALMGMKVTYVTVTLTGGAIKVAGHELVGRVDFEGDDILVNTRPGATMPLQYRNASRDCDHCKVSRKRNAVFVFAKDAGGHIQVGQSCLKDFLGHDPAQTLFAAREYAGIWDDIDEEISSGGSGGSIMVEMMEVMIASVFAIRLGGFTSKKTCEERSDGTMPTSSHVFSLLFDRKAREGFKHTAEDRAKAAAVVAWVQATWAHKDETSDYEYNAVQLTAREDVSPKRIGILTSLVAAYNRANEERVAREATVNAHIGVVGVRREFTAIYRGENAFETQFGVLHIARFQTDEGLVVYKGGTPFWPDSIKAGEAIKFMGTVKCHDNYKDTLQTIVSRCKLIAEKRIPETAGA